MSEWELLWLEKSKNAERDEMIENLEMAPKVPRGKGRYTVTPGSINA